MKITNNKWVMDQIRERRGIPCLSSTKFYKIGQFHVAVNEMEQWGGPSTMIMVLHKAKEETAMSCWRVDTAKDRKKTEKILDALSEPERLASCTGMGIDDIINSVKEAAV